MSLPTVPWKAKQKKQVPTPHKKSITSTSSIKDDTESIIGYPYEPRIPTLKDGQEKTLDFELRRNVDNLTVNLKYLDKDISYKIHLEEGHALHLYPECEEVSHRQPNDGDDSTEKHIYDRGNARQRGP